MYDMRATRALFAASQHPKKGSEVDMQRNMYDMRLTCALSAGYDQEPAAKRRRTKLKRKGNKEKRRKAIRSAPTDVWAAIFKQLPDLKGHLPSLRLVCRQVPSVIVAPQLVHPASGICCGIRSGRG